MSFKIIYYLELWLPFRSVEQSYLCNFGRGQYEEQFCEFILNSGQWFSKRCGLKDFYFLELWRPSWSVEQAEPSFSFERVFMGNIHVKLFKFGPVVQEEMLFKEKVYVRRRMMTDPRWMKTDHNTSP